MLRFSSGKRMLKSYIDKNLSLIFSKKPLYVLPILLRVMRGVYRRKCGVYAALKLDKSVQVDVSKLGSINFTRNHDEVGYWREQFLISNSSSFNWGLNRNSLLENLLSELLVTKKISSKNFDKEDYWSALQLNWLFFKVRTNNFDIEYVTSVINGACEFLGSNSDLWVSRPFTHSELVSNIVKISLLCGNKITLSKKTTEFIKFSINYILKNLEVYSKSDRTSLNHTNNHVLSNARALFWATKILPSHELGRVAHHVYKKYCLPLFDNGTLDEGSSIYHFVASQCIFDISYFVDLEKLPRVDRLILKLEGKGFLTPDKFPVIGDVSPDPSMVCVIDDALKIARKIHSEISSATDQNEAFKNNCDFEFFGYGHWNWILHNRGQNKHIQHSHNDYGSPILIYKNLPVLFDTGRVSYLNVDEPNDQTLTSFHTVPQIAGVDQNPRKARDLYPEIFISPFSSDIDWPTDLLVQLFGPHSKKYKIICGKKYVVFPNRLFGGSWMRFYIINLEDGKEFVIHDLVQLRESESVNFRFFIPQWIISKSLVEYKFQLDEKNIKPITNIVPCNNVYGQIAEACCMRVRSERSEQHTLTTNLRVSHE